jgi:hypothetical protein
MTYQRRRGIPATFYPIIKQTDNRGNEVKVVDDANPIPATIWVKPERGAKAEVTGQQTINVVRIGTSYDLPGVELRSRVEFQGKKWDVVSPPSHSEGTRRHTRHMEMDVRERP